MADDAVMNGFFRLKSLLIEAQEEFGEDLGKRLVAAAVLFKREHGGTTAEAYYGLRDAMLAKPIGTEVLPGTPRRDE